MSRARSPIRDNLEYYAVRVVLGLLRTLPPRLCVGLLKGVGTLCHHVLRERREASVENVMASLGVGRQRALEITKHSFQGLALNMGEPILLERVLEGKPLESHVQVDGAENYDKLFDGKGGILAMAHLGSWEGMGVVVERRFRPVHVVGRPLDNPKLRQFMYEVRSAGIKGHLPKDGIGMPIARLLKKGEPVAITLDQNSGRKGIMLDFFGRPAMQHKIHGVFAKRFGIPVVPLYVIRKPGLLRYHVVLEDPIYADPDLPEEEAVIDVVSRVSASLERRILEHPDQWLWIHDRWRRATRALRKKARREARARAEEAAQAEAAAQAAARARAETGEGGAPGPADGPGSDPAKAMGPGRPEGTNEGSRPQPAQPS